MKKLLLFILCIALSLSLLVACGGECKEHVDENRDLKCDECEAELPCPGHVDEDEDKMCDLCDEILIVPEEKTEVAVSFSVTDQDGAAVPGVKVIFTNKKGGTPVEATADDLGKLSATLEIGGYSVVYDYDVDAIGYYLSETTSITVANDTTAIELKMKNNNPNGTESRPYVISVGENSLTIPAGTTYHYTVYRAVDLLLDAKSDAIKITYAGATLMPENGNVHVELLGDNTNAVENFTIENTSASELTFEVELYSRPGTIGNPLVIEAVGETVTAEGLIKGDMTYYTYTATESGTLTVTLESPSCYLAATNTRNSVSDNTLESSVITLEVQAGDVINIDCSTQLEEATDVSFTLAYRE